MDPASSIMDDSNAKRRARSIALEERIRARRSLSGERTLTQQISCNMLFFGVGRTDNERSVWDDVTFSKNCDPLMAHDVMADLFNESAETACVQCQMSDEHISVDGALVGHGRVQRGSDDQHAPSLRAGNHREMRVTWPIPRLINVVRALLNQNRRCGRGLHIAGGAGVHPLPRPSANARFPYFQIAPVRDAIQLARPLGLRAVYLMLTGKHKVGKKRLPATRFTTMIGCRFADSSAKRRTYHEASISRTE